MQKCYWNEGHIRESFMGIDIIERVSEGHTSNIEHWHNNSSKPGLCIPITLVSCQPSSTDKDLKMCNIN